MSRKRRHGPPANTRNQRQYDAPRHVMPQGAGGVGLADRGGHDNGGNGGNGGGPATIVMRDADGHPYVVLADSAGRGGYGASTAYAQGARQAQTATAQAAQAMQATSPNGGTGFAAKPYPDMPKVSDAKPLLRSLGATGTAIFSGIITSEEYNEDFYWKDAIQVYEQMIRNDAQIFAVVQLLELPIRRAIWTIEPGGDEPRDEEIASFVETCLFHEMRYTTSEGRTLTQKWDDILRHILMMLRFGFMAFETNWRIEDGWTKWARWTPLLPRTVWRWWVGDDNELVGIQQWTFKNYSYQFVDIPADKLLLFVHRQEGNNYEGVSVLRSAYKHWYYKDNFYKIEAIDIERNAAEIPAIYLPEQFTDADLANAQSILQNMRVNENMGVTLPPGWKIEYIRTYGRQTAGVQPSIEHHDAMIARNVLGQFINLGSHEVGSYALAETQRAMLLAALQAECEYIEDVINNDAIPRLVDYNFEGVENYPRIKASKLIAQDLDVISTALNKLTSAPSGPLIHGDPDLEDYLRDLYGLPKAPQGVVQGTNPTAPSTPERPETDTAQDAAGDDHADAESKDATPTAQQQAVSQAVANGAPNVQNTKGAMGGAAPVQAADGDAAMGEESRLLREALAAAYDHDAVERALTFGSAEGEARVPPGSPHGGEWTTSGGGDIGGGSSMRGRTSSGSGRGAARGGAAHHGGSGGSTRGSGGSGKTKGEGEAKAAKAPRAAKPKPTAPKESIHERAARLQREGGLPKEVRPGADLTVTGRADHVPNPALAPDARFLTQLYGEHQLGAALSRYSPSEVKLTAEKEGVKPGRSKAETISAITAHVTEGRYSANFGASKGEGGAKAEAGARGTRGAGKSAKSEEERYQAKRAQLQAEVNQHAQEMADHMAAFHAGNYSRIGEATIASTAKGEAERKLAALDRAHARAVAKAAGDDGASRPATTAKSAREAELERQVAALRSENEALKAGGAGSRGAKANGRGKAATEEPLGLPAYKRTLGIANGRPYNPLASSVHSARWERDSFGLEGLRQSLAGHDVRTLRSMARSIQTVHPGTKPRNASSRSGLIDYIYEQMAAEGEMSNE